MSNVIKFVKKVFTFGVVSSTILWSSMVSVLVPTVASAATCPSLNAGDMVKVTGRPAIYAVNNDLKVLYFPSGDEFKSWTLNNTYGGYVSVTQECFDSLQVPSTYPGAVNFRPGTYVVKRASSDQLYVVLPGNSLAKITPEAASALYGSGYKAFVVQDAFWPHYVNRGADVTTAKPHEGMLVSNGGKTWYVDAGAVLREVTATGMTANRFQTKFVHVVTDAMITGYTQGDAISAEVKTLVDRVQAGGAAAPGPTPVGGNLTVSLASDNPAGTYLASGTALNPLLKVVLAAGSNDVSVTSLRVRKGGFYANTNVTGADVIDSKGMRHGNIVSTLTADNDVLLTFTNDPVVVKAGTNETLTVRLNLASGNNTGTIQLSLAAPTSLGSNGTIAGTFPVTGNTFNVQDGSNSVAAILLNPQLVWSNATLNADGTNAQDLAKFSVQETSSREAIKVKKFTIYNNGTAADSDYKDVQLVEQSSNTVLATAQPKDKTVTFDLGSSGYLIDKGQTKYFVVRAILVGGAARTLQFVVYQDSDAEILGITTNALILPTTNSSAGNSSATSFPAGNATNYNLVTVGSGSLSFNKDASSPAAAVTPGATNVVLAKFFAKSSGEDMELRKVVLGITSAGSTTLTGTVYVKVDGAIVYSAAASGINATTSGASVTLSTYPILKSNVTSYITVEGSISTSATSTNAYRVYLRPSEVKRLITNDVTSATTVVPAANSSGNSIAVQGTNLAVVNMATPVAQSVVAGTNSFELAKVELNAGNSGEDIRVNTIKFTDTQGGSAADADLSSFVLYQNGQALVTTGSTNALSSSEITFTLASPILVSRTSPVILSLKADVVAGTSGTHVFAVAAAGDITAYGKDSGNAATVGAPTGTGQTMTLAASGTVTLSLVSGPNATPAVEQLVNVASTNVPVFAFKLSAQNEAQKLTSLTLTASSTAGYFLGSNDVVNLKLYRNNETSAFAAGNQMSCTGNLCTYTWAATDNLLPSAVEPGAPVTIYVKADVGNAGIASVTNTFKFLINATSTDILTKGAFSGATSTVAGSAQATALTHIAPWNVKIEGVAPATDSTVSQNVTAGTQIARFKLTNNGSGQITITNLNFTDNGSHTSTSVLYDLYYSSEGSTDYTANTASTTVSDTLNFTTGFTNFTLNGGAYRYVTVAIDTAAYLADGDSFALAIAALGDVKYSVTEANLGYDNNGDGDQADTVTGVYVDGKPALGTFVRNTN